MKMLALFVAILFAGGTFFSGSNSLFAEEQRETAQEEMNEDAGDLEELERQIDEDEQLEIPDKDQGIREEEGNYPDERHQDDRG